MRLTTGGKVGNFFRRIGRGVKKVYHFVNDKAIPFVKQKLAPVVSPIAGLVAGAASLIPHPIAQGIAVGATATKKVADKLSEGGS